MKQTFQELAEMCEKCLVMQQKRQWSLTVYASSKSDSNITEDVKKINSFIVIRILRHFREIE